ncbi:MAG: DUF4157 domain-containing protein [Sinobacteraceae bacterium]|nr:DUF4157 domain-containing protein [Nevskiaceae bacterium]MCP5466749.1 DUF4157 domain-containing protein [Nevskiaceae bacterium]MCP5470550.1 DUF4157 domain-containing protein [Nevskiaceae bacterium]
MGRRVPLPPEVRRTLHRLFGDGVDRVEIIEHSWWMRLHGRAQATTRRRRIYLRGSAADFFENPVLLLHEYFHVLRQWEPRQLSVWRYLLEWFRRGYWDNRFEVEAREFTEDHLYRFRAWLAQDRGQPPESRDV